MTVQAHPLSEDDYPLAVHSYPESLLVTETATYIVPSGTYNVRLSHGAVCVYVAEYDPRNYVGRV